MINFNNNIINNKFYNKKLKKKKFIKFIKKKINFLLKNKFNNKYFLNFKIKKIKIYKKSNKSNINKYEEIDDNKLKYIINYIHKKIGIYLFVIRYKYYQNKVGSNIRLRIDNINYNLLILKDKYDNTYFYRLKHKTEFFSINKYYYFLIKSLNINKKNLKIYITLSRSDVIFLKNLFKLLIPEIYSGDVKIINIARYLGRNKVVVSSNNKKIDPVGSCLGVNLLRLKNILKELDNEKIQIIKYSSNLNEYIKNIFYKINIQNKVKKNKIYIYYDVKDAGKLIGKYGSNIKLCKLLLNKYKLIIKCQ